MEQAYARLEACSDEATRIEATAHLILAIFDDFYSLLCEYPYRAKCAFELMDPHASIRIMGVQAALFSPSKYGILPETLPHEKLSSGNGLMEMWTNLAIIGGTVAGGIIVYSRGLGPGWGHTARGSLGAGAGRRAGNSAGSCRAFGRWTGRDIPARLEGDTCRPYPPAGNHGPGDRLVNRQPGPRSGAGLRDEDAGAAGVDVGLPLAAIGIGIGVGSLAAGTGPRLPRWNMAWFLSAPWD